MSKYPSETITCSVCVYIFPYIHILLNKFFLRLKEIRKIPCNFSKTLQLHYKLAFSMQQAAMLVDGSTEDHMFDGRENTLVSYYYL